MENILTTRLSPRKERTKYINQTISLWQQSGLSKNKFCRENNIKASTFHGWINRKKKHLHNTHASGFAAIDLKEETMKKNQPFAEIDFPDGVHINLLSVVSAPFLRALIRK